MQIKRVHLCPGDDCGWALDEDLRLLRGALAGACALTSVHQAEAVHAVWWQRLLSSTRRDFEGKHVLCYADNAPFCYATDPYFLKAKERVTLWIARSREAIAQFSTLGIESRFAPYTFDPSIFRPLPPDDAEVRALIEKWRIPTDRYLIANFHRDTEGGDLKSPKLQKGPDAFLEIVSSLHEEGAPVHILLAGPRRFFLRQSLKERGVPFTFLGQETDGKDDLGINILPRSELNVLYSIADLHLISSRWEGGPHSVLESAATRCKIISTPVGIAPDVLAPECLFSDITEACEIIKRDLSDDFLAPLSEAHFKHAHQHHSQEALRRHLLEIYGSLAPMRTPARGMIDNLRVSWRRQARKVTSRFREVQKPLRIAILHRSEEPPSPLDAMFEQLTVEFEKKGHSVLRNELNPTPDGVLLGEIADADPLLAQLTRLDANPVIGLFNEMAASSESALAQRMARHMKFDAWTLLPSLDALDALRKAAMLPRRVLVFPPVAAPQQDEPPEPLAIWEGDHWAAGRIQRALASKRPVLYPSSSHYRWLVWFGGVACAGADDISQKLDSLITHCSMFKRMIPGSALPPPAETLVRLFRVCQEILADED